MFIIVILLSEIVNWLLTDSSMEWNDMSQEKRRVRRNCRTSPLLFSLQYSETAQNEKNPL